MKGDSVMLTRRFVRLITLSGVILSLILPTVPATGEIRTREEILVSQMGTQNPEKLKIAREGFKALIDTRLERLATFEQKPPDSGKALVKQARVLARAARTVDVWERIEIAR